MRSIWTFLQGEAKDMHLIAGMSFRTTLLGRVTPVRGQAGKYLGVIPAKLYIEAKRHGFEIISANYKDNSYMLKLL